MYYVVSSMMDLFFRGMAKLSSVNAAISPSGLISSTQLKQQKCQLHDLASWARHWNLTVYRALLLIGDRPIRSPG